MIDKTYEAAAIEPRISARWTEAEAFKAGAGKTDGAPAFSIVIPPPNVTGSLHMGHALNNTLQDILVRFERMRGKDVLWQPGTDHAGIATQMVVERQMAASGESQTRREMGREKFVERIWQWKAESGGKISEQLKRLGASLDWSRERFTMDEGLSEAVLEVFVRLYEEGLIYRDKRLVNWDPHFQTSISDLEVESREVEGHMWHFKYPLAGGETYEYVEKDEDGNVLLRETRDYISIATTRPETMLGDGAVAVHPSDERYAPIVGKLCEIPVGPKDHRRLIPIITDEYPDPTFGSGAVKITGAHDFNDYGVAKRGNIPLYRLMDEHGALRADGTPYAEAVEMAKAVRDSGKVPDTAHVDTINLVPDEYRGLDRFEARKRVVADITAEGNAIMVPETDPRLGPVSAPVAPEEGGEQRALVPLIEAKKIMQPFGDRSGVVIEPMLTDQWFVDAETLAKPAITSVKEERTKFVPKQWENTYFRWMEDIQPWCISRQLWWGHRIPAWYGPDGKVFVARTEADAIRAAEGHYGSQVELVRDEDVLDTWFSSALWPFSTMGWPHETPEMEKYYPTSVLSTAFDIIFFWVARMMMMGLHFTGKEPFHTVYMHPLVRDKFGQKMSKSKGNGIDPLDLIEEVGADALRFTLAALAVQGRDVKLDPARVAGYRNFCTKLWNATRFAQMNEAKHGVDIEPASLQLPINRWIVTELSKAEKEATAALEAYRFNDAAAILYRFVWNLFCDWYVELTKPTLNGEDADAAGEVRVVTGFVLDRIFVLLHPFMPFITEELWAETASGERATLLCHASWTSLDFEAPESADDLNWLIDIVGQVRSVRVEMNVPGSAKVTIAAIAPDALTADRLKRHGPQLSRLARLEAIQFAESVPPQSAQLVVAGVTFAIPLAGVIDIAAEKSRLAKAIQKNEGEIARIEKKLGNAKFVANAPDEIVAAEREKSEAYGTETTSLKAALARLG
ncbi:valyl-tRNA synthetase (valine-tRNA ligase) protein [Fulvimarina pelagi HTCC2506]|uniref:Valine--tRNA ligase n=2 Tax=Fulvimarina pelagi TaxID=217511 RepID=Q0FZQ5_9HYPH|nr:valine--tRNA ligase [Fulvimarina pelagi]EAU40536.1 valyl-tRNA synthetase (valine-tRNA ligase) protein [Fulvimarina pelagi HTCC2506]BAT31559.1 valyl-tRNA synthetase protein [Fulvimarina pelagi]